MVIGCQITCLNIDFAQLMNGNLTMLGRRLYSPNLKDIAGLEDTRVYRQTYEKIRSIN